MVRGPHPAGHYLPVLTPVCITNPQEAVNPELEELKVQTPSKTALLQVGRGNLPLTWRSRHITHGKAVGRPEPQQSEAISHSWRVEAVPSQEVIQKLLWDCMSSLKLHVPVSIEKKSYLGEWDVMFYPHFLKLLLAVTSALVQYSCFLWYILTLSCLRLPPRPLGDTGSWLT